MKLTGRGDRESRLRGVSRRYCACSRSLRSGPDPFLLLSQIRTPSGPELYLYVPDLSLLLCLWILVYVTAGYAYTSRCGVGSFVGFSCTDGWIFLYQEMLEAIDRLRAPAQEIRLKFGLHVGRAVECILGPATDPKP